MQIDSLLHTPSDFRTFSSLNDSPPRENVIYNLLIFSDLPEIWEEARQMKLECNRDSYYTGITIELEAGSICIIKRRTE